MTWDFIWSLYLLGFPVHKDLIKWHTRHIYTHRGKSLWQSVGDKVFSITLHNKWTIMNAQLQWNSYGTAYYVHINAKRVHCEACCCSKHHRNWCRIRTCSAIRPVWLEVTIHLQGSPLTYQSFPSRLEWKLWCQEAWRVLWELNISMLTHVRTSQNSGSKKSPRTTGCVSSLITEHPWHGKCTKIQWEIRGRCKLEILGSEDC